MSNCHLIIDARPHTGPPRDHGLPHAVPYFETFPVMPSPSEKGSLYTSSSRRTVMLNTSLEAVLDAINNNVENQGTVLLVCHADGNGLYMKLATGSAWAESQNLEQLLEWVFSIEIIGRPASAQNIPETWLAEKRIEDWRRLWSPSIGERSHRPFETTFSATTAREARDIFFRQLTADAASWDLEGWRGLARLATKILDVRSKRLDRLELRACWIGLVRFANYTLKNLFGCGELVAPKELNFFLDLPIYHYPLQGIRRARGPARPRGPLSQVFNQGLQRAEAALRGPHTRVFRDYMYMVRSSSYTTYTSFPTWPAIAVTVNQKEPSFDFDGRAYVCNPTEAIGPSKEDRDIVRWFVNKYIQYGYGDQWLVTHATGRLAIPLHGFWTPRNTSVFVLPEEPSYVKMINRM
jgi:hypothetical protein